jgi:hypothetical protein
MDYPPFYRTRRGEQFFCKTVPDLIRLLERLNELRERLVATQKGNEPKNDDTDA